jgi:hypothetical protein
MSKILRRPMFRGGQVDSRGTGITSGLGYQAGGRVGYKSAGFVTGGELMDLAQTFPELNKFKNMTINPYTKFKIGEGKMIGSPSGKFEGKFDVDRVASFRGTPGMQDLAFLLPGEAYNLSTSLGGDKKKDDNELIVSKDPNFIPNKNENITVDDDMSFDIDKERSNRIALEESERMQKNQLSELLKDMSKNEQYEKDIGAQRKETVDQPIAGVVTEQESFEDDGTEMGFQSMADKADSFYEALTGGAEERAAKRLALEEAKSKDKILRARKTDAFNTMLKFFEGSQQEGATVGSSAAEASKYLTSKPSATELAMDKRDTREEALADRAFVLDEKRRDTAGQMAFKEYMQQEAFDFSDVKSKKDFDRKMSMLEKKLKSAETIAEKNIIAQAIRDAKKQWAPGSLEKDLTTLGNLTGSKRKEALALKGYPLDIVSYLKEKQNVGSKVTGEGILGAVEFYYGPEFQGMIGMEDELKDKEPGVYLKSDMSSLVIIDAEGNPRIQSLII